jgi:hypothetical protein
LGYRCTTRNALKRNGGEANKATGWSEIAADMRVRPMEDFHGRIPCIRTCILEQLRIEFVVL